MKKDETPTTTPPRKRMPAEVFVKIWKGEMKVAGTEWERWVTYGKHHSGTHEIKFSNLEVFEYVCIERNEVLLSNLVLSNCQVSGFRLLFAQVRIVAFFERSIIGDISIESSTTGHFSISKNSTTGRLTIQNKSETGDFWITDYSSTQNFLIRGNSKTGNLSIQSNSTTGSLEIVDNSVTGDFLIQEASINGEIGVRDNSIVGNIKVLKNSTIKRFFMQGNSIGGEFKIDNSKAATLSLSENSQLTEMNLSYSILQRVEIRSGSFVGYLKCKFNLQEPIRLLFENSILVCMDFKDSVFPEFTTLSVSNCSINYLRLTNLCNYGAVFFSSLRQIEKWEEVERHPHGQIIRREDKYQFKTASHPSTLCFTDSDLGKMQFINCDLREFKRFEFSNTKMLEVFVAGSQMPGDKAFCLPNDEKDPLKIAEQKRLAYSQFKKIYEARGDTASSLRYLAFEMQAYREELRLEKPKSRKEWFDNKGERFILWFNRHSTNYGNNWLRGVLVTLFVTVVCFAIYCLALGYRPQPIGGDWEKLGDLASHSLAYLNPFRDEDSGEFFEMLKKDGLTITWYARLWDYVSRIFIAYFVYQTIQAFRKLGKSSG